MVMHYKGTGAAVDPNTIEIRIPAFGTPPQPPGGLNIPPPPGAPSLPSGPPPGLGQLSPDLLPPPQAGASSPQPAAPPAPALPPALVPPPDLTPGGGAEPKPSPGN
jgi:hypothetical protein